MPAGLRRSDGFSAVNGLAAGLLVLAAVELFFALQAPDAATPDALLPLPQTSDSRISAAAVSGWRETVLGRPLFDPSRRPQAIATASAPAAPLPRLSGIMVTPTEKLAVFSPATGGPVVVSENSRFGPFTVLSISLGSVVVRGPQGVSVLTSKFDGEGGSARTTPMNTVLAGGINLSLIRVRLPSAASWPGPPQLR